VGVGGLTWSFLSLLLTQAAEGRQKAQEGEEHAQVGDDAKTLGRIEIDGRSELGMHANVLEFQVHMLMPSSPP
jgi:hypothetical protein